MAVPTYLVTYLVPVTIPVEVSSEASARRSADDLVNRLAGATVRIHVQGAPFTNPVIVEAEIGLPSGDVAIVLDGE